eukprot:13004733-Ditylum_brightwellii.AAC.1
MKSQGKLTMFIPYFQVMKHLLYLQQTTRDMKFSLDQEVVEPRWRRRMKMEKIMMMIEMIMAFNNSSSI